MERFINQIDKSEPIPVRELRSLEEKELNEALHVFLYKSHYI